MAVSLSTTQISKLVARVSICIKVVTLASIIFFFPFPPTNKNNEWFGMLFVAFFTSHSDIVDYPCIGMCSYARTNEKYMQSFYN